MKDSCLYGPDPSGVKMFSLLFVLSVGVVHIIHCVQTLVIVS